ncbi:reverse transcriptase [Phytophthora megakarya]|uniref:Reverse transcriptase n=1 Tax=Phytophthora megakarya TaxID=4795 RepID=A0A225WN52_9STRA|nr:reverse transcriptase [Phytophthora megakarya]
MPFCLYNAPQLYQRLIDNALYGFWKLSSTEDTRDVFQDGVPSKSGTRSGKAWDDLCKKVELLLEICEEWHLSISVEKSEWGMPRVNYWDTRFRKMKSGEAKELGSTSGAGFPVAVKFTSRTLKHNELNYNIIIEKEILARLHVLNECHNMMVGKTIRVLTRHTTLGWLFGSKGLARSSVAMGRHPLSLAIGNPPVSERGGRDSGSVGCKHHAEGPCRFRVGRYRASKRPSKTAAIPVPKIGRTESLRESPPRVKREGGAFSAVVWQLPNRDVVKTASGYAEGLTGNEAEYRGMLLGLSLLEDLDVTRLIICGDSNLAVRQMRGEMDYGLKLLRQQALKRAARTVGLEFLHVRRDWNASEDMLDGQTFQRQGGKDVHSVEEIEDLKTLNRLGEVLQPTLPVPGRETRGTDDPRRGTRRVYPVTTRSRDASHQTTRRHPEAWKEIQVQRLRLDRVRTAQDEEIWIANLKKFLSEDISELSKQEEVGESGLLYYHARGDESTEDRDSIMKLVVPETLRQDVLNHYHASLEGGHQGIGQTYQRIRHHFTDQGFKTVQRHVGECVDCESGNCRPTIQGESPGNIIATYPFQVVAMDHIPSLPASHKRNTELLIWVDLFTCFVIAKASASRTAQTVAESYEEAVFMRFGASEAIRHDREPGFMSDFFRAFNKFMDRRLRVRPQANGAAERMVQTITRAIKMYIADNDQRDWDEYAERLSYAQNTAHDRTWDETPFSLVHGWDPRSTLEATLAIGNTSHRDVEARRWRMRIPRHYKTARTQTLELIRKEVDMRTTRQKARATEHAIQCGSQGWLYLDRVKPGYARKLAHLWHGPFRVANLVSTHAVRLETIRTPYQLFPIVHVSKLKPVREFPSRPELRLTVPAEERFDFDEELLPEVSWEAHDADDEVYEVEQILDAREGRTTRYG